jgi:hypothetical protein
MHSMGGGERTGKDMLEGFFLQTAIQTQSRAFVI